MHRISGKLILLLILTALVPITIFGAVAVWTARETAGRIISKENIEIAKRASHQIEQYISDNSMVLEALAENLAKTDLEDWQKERIVKNFALKFDQFEEIDVAGRSGEIMATSRLDQQPEGLAKDEAVRSALSNHSYRSRVFISDNFVPSMVVAVPLVVLGQVEGAVRAELNLIEMWKLVDSIRIGREGYAFVASQDGLLIAHGKGSEKERVLKEERVDDLPIVAEALQGRPNASVYRDRNGITQIGVSVPVSGLGWGLVIEQPTHEAYAAARRLTYGLTGLTLFLLGAMVLIGTSGGNRYVVRPIRELIRGTRVVGGGNLAEKVKILSNDEFGELGDAFNNMTDQLSSLKEDIRNNERAAFLGRIAGGLVHDLRHPVRNLENSSRLMLTKYENKEIRDLFQKVTNREFANLDRFFDDLIDVSRPSPMHPAWLRLSGVLEEIIQPYRSHPKCILEGPAGEPTTDLGNGKVHVKLSIEPSDLRLWADRFAFERVLKNLVNNAIEAMPEGGGLTVSAAPVPGDSSSTQITVSDTGDGIPDERLRNLFVDYGTTKKKGIGLGLPVCKRIMDDHYAAIEVRSQTGQGTTFTLRFPPPGPSTGQ